MVKQEFTTHTTSDKTLSQAQWELISALSYYSIFRHPLTDQEIFDNSKFSGSLIDIQQELKLLIQAGLIEKKQNYYLLPTLNEKDIEQRIENEQSHKAITPLVEKYARFISKFPFVRAVCLSGSYSKGVYGDKHDIDYFVITTSNRLWICRSLLRGYKKFIASKQKEKYFCLNYFIEEKQLEVPDKNIFVATEVKTLLPAYNYELFMQFQQANRWSNQYLPNRKPAAKALIDGAPKGHAKKIVEKLLSGSFGNFIEHYLFKFMQKRRKRLFKEFNEEEFNLNMRTEKHTEKHHPRGMQQKVLSQLNELMQQYTRTIN